jgi:hypothetical protein
LESESELNWEWFRLFPSVIQFLRRTAGPYRLGILPAVVVAGAVAVAVAAVVPVAVAHHRAG